MTSSTTRRNCSSFWDAVGREHEVCALRLGVSGRSWPTIRYRGSVGAVPFLLASSITTVAKKPQSALLSVIAIVSLGSTLDATRCTCSQEINQTMVTDHDIELAQHRITGHVRRTPTMSTAAGELGVGHDLTLKLECLQHTGSFKPRGAFNLALASEIPRSGLIAASGGNHGVAVAYVARQLGHHAEIFVPAISPKIKVDRVAALGAELHIGGTVYAEAQAACDIRQSETGALTLHPYDAVETVAGQATCGRELQAQHPEIDTVVVAVGGGGLAAGFAAAYRDSVKLVTVEPETSRCLGAAFDAGEPVDVTVSGVAADSLGASRIGQVPWSLLSIHTDVSVSVSDDAITAARKAAFAELQIVLEPGGAAALAALMSGTYTPEPGERVAVILCGANADPGDLV